MAGWYDRESSVKCTETKEIIAVSVGQPIF